MTELTDLNDTDALNTAVTGNSTEGNTANMGGMDNLFQATLGMLSRFRNANIFRLRDNTDNTKLLAFDLSGLPTGTTTTLTVPAGGTLGLATPWVAYTPTVTGFGTVSSVAFFSRRVGDTLEVRGNFTAGTTTAVGAEFTLGFNGTNGGVTTDTSKMASGRNVCGVWASSLAMARAQYLIANGGASAIAFSDQTATRNSLQQMLGNQAASAADIISVQLSVCITGW